jgi:polyhydroxyalkanoate synthesis repressor PhaR
MPQRRSDVTIIKKYANRRLYHTEISQYITLDDVADMVRKGEELKVVDARTGQDLTRAILTQIIVEQEAKGENLLPVKFLREVIRTYQNNMRPILPHYLDHAMDTLMNNQEQFSKYWTDQVGNAQKNMPMGMLPAQAVQKFNDGVEEIARQNLQLFESAMKVFSPFMPVSVSDKKQKVDSLKQQIRAIQNRINDLEKMAD